jgi:hypothetical protein
MELEALIQNFTNKGIQDFFRRKISSFRPVEEFLSTDLPENFSNLRKLGEVEYTNSNELLVFSCAYHGVLSERSSKKRQYEIAKKALKEDFKDGAIFIFYDQQGNFRFSFIQKNFGEKGDKKYSTWRRYTYYVSPQNSNRTFLTRVGACNFASLEAIKEAFSVEPLNKEFYDKIVRCFYSLVGGEVGTGRNKETLKANLVLPGNKTDRTIVRQFGVRLVGRIIFCWFLKHKHSSKGIALIPENWLSRSSVTSNYYHGLLELLFFEVLNRELKERPKHLPNNHELIPFLNGGLFEPQTGADSDYYDKSKRTPEQRSNHALRIADKWFKELFDVLEQYNFTIDENSVNDAEVSIDPEMLGRIFENLLAEIDPNLDSNEKTSVRKATGSYYTPREIVDHMVEASLVKYLHNSTAIEEKRLYQLFDDSKELDFTYKQIAQLISAFDKVKILDPAAGSGAFPMGCLHKIVLALQKLDPGATIWKKKQLDKIQNAAVKAEMKEILDKANAEYARKLGVLQQCIYGADIQPIAAEISRLRSFLSLIVDEEINDSKPNRGVVALPNLDFKFVTANTLISLNHSRFETELVGKKIPELQAIREDYLQAHGSEKEELRKRFKRVQKQIYEHQLENFGKFEGSRVDQLTDWDPFVNREVKWFDPEWMFGIKQFDIIIGNPPYGGTPISDELKLQSGLGSKDPYGAFIAKYLRRRQNIGTCIKTPLRHGGILSFIVSDTFMTIKSHKQLRDLILENRIHSMIRVHPDTFKATVNTAIILCERLESETKEDKSLLMADFTNTSIHEQHDRFLQLLAKVTEYTQPEYEGEALEQNCVLYMKGNNWTSESSEEYGVFTYLQSLIQTNGNHPFFVSSGKLFALMNDTTSRVVSAKVDGHNFNSRIMSFNDQDVVLAKLQDIASVKQGIATGDNHSYLFQNANAHGTYKNVADFSIYVLTEKDLQLIRSDEALRKQVIEKGISKVKTSILPYFNGRYIIPYDKGGESASDTGWMPNYYVPTEYYIDWSSWSVERMRTLTIGQRDENERTQLCSVLRNIELSFLPSLTSSRVGQYSPTFRIGSLSAFDSGCSNIFSIMDEKLLLGKLTSRLFKFLLKSCINHTVNSQSDDNLEVFVDLTPNMDVINLVNQIIKEQKVNQSYDFASCQQLELDYLVYKTFSFNWFDVIELENWYARRYPKLVAAQKANLAALGKPTDYVEIYKSFIPKYGDLAN